MAGKISLTILRLFRTERPQLFYTLIGCFLLAVSIILIIPVVLAFIETGLVLRFPTAILSTGIAISALLSFACGLILDTVTQGRREAKMLAYLAVPRQAMPVARPSSRQRRPRDKRDRLRVQLAYV